MNHKLAILLACIMAIPQSWGMQQVQTIKWQRPDVMVEQGLNKIDDILSFKTTCIIIGASLGIGASLWSYAHAHQKAAEIRHRNKMSANNAYLQEQKSLNPLIVPVLMQASYQKPRREPGGYISKNVAEHIITFMPDQKFSKEQHKKLAHEYAAELEAATTKNTNIKAASWVVPLTTCYALSAVDKIKSNIRFFNTCLLRPITNFSLHLYNGEFKKAAKHPLPWIVVSCYLLYKYRRPLARRILGM